MTPDERQRVLDDIRRELLVDAEALAAMGSREIYVELRRARAAGRYAGTQEAIARLRAAGLIAGSRHKDVSGVSIRVLP